MALIRIPWVPPGAPSEDLPRIKATKKIAIVCGSARCLWDDLAELEGVDADLVAVGFSGMALPRRPVHWVSQHAFDFQWMLPYLKRGRVLTDSGLFVRHIETHSNRACACVLHVWPKSVMPDRGSSGESAARVSLAMGYERVILAGVPLDDQGHFYDPPPGLMGASYYNYSTYVKSWESSAAEFAGRVRSVSGLTRDLLGAP